MSDKLNKGLDEIVSAQRRTAGRRRSQRRTPGRAATTAPAGGVQKKANAPRGGAGKGSPAKGATPNGDSKVIVSNLEYFVQSVGPIKRVELSYGPNSQSRGIANVIFNKPDGASKAFQKLNGLLVDNRPIKIEIVVGAAYADKVMPQVKTLAERASQPKGQAKAQPKSAAAGKQANGKKAEAGKGAANKKRRARSARPAKKTAEELDTDMNDYWKTQPANGGAAGGDAAAAPAAAPAGAAPAANGDAAMEDEIMYEQ